jgi:hypothetical protein
MWKFTGLASGAYGLHLDATSSGENFVFRTSSDKGASWTALGASARTWAGDFALGTVSSGELWVEVIDGSTGTDRTRNTISVDLLTIETVGVPTGGALAAADLMG